MFLGSLVVALGEIRASFFRRVESQSKRAFSRASTPGTAFSRSKRSLYDQNRSESIIIHQDSVAPEFIEKVIG